jgi:hypothetical protein
MNLKRTIEVPVTVTPEECAELFALNDTHFQARFLNHLGALAARSDGELTGGWFETQCLSIVRDEGVPEITDDAKHALTNLQDYLCSPINAAGFPDARAQR